MSSQSERALDLKNKGNALYLQKKWKDAHTLYVEGTSVDPNNAILWANRAACSLQLKKHSDAAEEAKKATECGSKYAKAWGRLGSALEALDKQDEALEAYRMVISLLKLGDPQRNSCEDAVARLTRPKQEKKPQSKGPRAQGISAVRMRGGFNRPFNPEPINLEANHPVYSEGMSKELMKYEASQEKWDNQSITFLMIEKNGFAKPRWQSYVGPCVVARKDMKPLDSDQLEVLWMFNDHLLDVFGDDPERAQQMMTPQSFSQWCKQYIKNMHLNKRLKDLSWPF